MVLLIVTTDGINLDNPRNLSQLWFDDPVLDLPQAGCIEGITIRSGSSGQGLHRIHENFAKAGGNGTHLRLQPRWKHTFDSAQAFVDQVAGEVDVGAFFEHHGDLRQAVAGDRAGVRQIGQAVQRSFHREGDALLRLQGRVTWCLRIDLHLDVGDIRYCVDGQALEAPYSDSDQYEDQG